MKTLGLSSFASSQKLLINFSTWPPYTNTSPIITSPSSSQARLKKLQPWRWPRPLCAELAATAAGELCRKNSEHEQEEGFYRRRQSYRQRLEISKRRHAFLRSYQLSFHPTRRQAMAGTVKRLPKLVGKLRSAAASFSACYRRHPTATTTSTARSIDHYASNM